MFDPSLPERATAPSMHFSTYQRTDPYLLSPYYTSTALEEEGEPCSLFSLVGQFFSCSPGLSPAMLRKIK